MNVDFSPFFNQYEQLVSLADHTFQRVKEQYPDKAVCVIHCSDCCYAAFDLSLIEAIYINHKFNQVFHGNEKYNILEKANKADRMLYKYKRKFHKQYQEGRPEHEILAEMAVVRIRCPLLNEYDQCDLYQFRPITCRFYGIPTAIAGKAHTCWKSGFQEGEQYPTVNLDIIHQKLYQISDQLIKAIQSKYHRMADILVPLSMALLNTYDEEYLGLPSKNKDKDNESIKEDDVPKDR